MSFYSFLEAFASELNWLAGRRLLLRTWLLDGSWNRYSWLHARIFGALVRSVSKPFVPMIETKWNRGFEPDLCIADPDRCLVDEFNSLVGVLEYESTNSSDERLFGKDLWHFEKEILEYRRKPDKLPHWWLVISTLPGCRVSKAVWWPGWAECADYPPDVKSKDLRDANPLAYFEDHLHSWIAQAWTRIVDSFGEAPPTQVIWANMDDRALRVMSVNGRAPDVEIQHPLQLAE